MMGIHPALVFTVVVCLIGLAIVYVTHSAFTWSENETPSCNGKRDHMLGPWQDGEWEAKHYSRGLGKGYLTRMEMKQTRSCLDCGLTETRTTTRSGAPKAKYLW